MLAVTCWASSDAFASRARLLVMGAGDAGLLLDGGGSGGSMVVDDAYNMFYNPSYVNDYQDWAIIEKSNAFSGGTNNAQGGFATSMMNWNMAFFMNRTAAVQHMTSANKNNMKPFDFMIGSSFNKVKWGLGLTYGSFSGANTGVDTDLDVKLGAQFSGFEPFGSYRVVGNDRTSGSDIVNKKYMLGFRYHWGEWVPYAAWTRSKTDNKTTTVNDVVNSNFGVGVARNMMVAEGVKANYGFGFWRKMKAADQNVIPIDVSVEGNVNSWMTLRGGLSYRLMDRSEGQTQTDATTGRMGAGFHFGKLTMDWAVGTGSTGAGSLDAATFGFDNSFFTAASVAYNW